MKKHNTATSYFFLSRSPAFSLMAMFPLLLIYEIFALYLANNNLSFANFPTIFLEILIGYSGIHGPFILGAVFLAAIIIAFLLKEKKRFTFRPYFFAVLLIESVFYALLLGYLIFGLTEQLYLMLRETGTKLLLSVGAGFYEELVFRGLLFYVTALALIKLHASRIAAFAFTAVISSLAFSFFHYVNNEPFVMSIAFYRFALGLLFCGLMMFRGLAVCAWTHTFYNIFIYSSASRII